MRFCVFSGSSKGSDPAFLNSAATLGTALARRDIGFVYGGAGIGLMGAAADAALAAGGEAIGVLPEALARAEIPHPNLTELHIVSSMHERKAMMSNLSDAFIALPGGFGTLEETFEILTWLQLGIHNKPIGLLNTVGFYDTLLRFLDEQVSAGFVRAEHRALLHSFDDADALIDALALETKQAAERPPVEKWIEP